MKQKCVTEGKLKHCWVRILEFCRIQQFSYGNGCHFYFQVLVSCLNSVYRKPVKV
jgi:hypothetical protein